MSNSHYEPPKQSAFGQFFDSILLMALVILALFAPLKLNLAAGAKTEIAVADKTTWAGLGQSVAQQAQWEKLGLTPETAAPMVVSRFDYSFDLFALLVTAAVIIGYFLLLFRFSEIEYRDVISERFGKK